MPTALLRAGSLEETSYPELLKRMHDEGETGTLVLEHDGVEKQVSFRRGRLVFARSSNPDDRLGEFLLRRGEIDIRQYLDSAERIGPGRRQGTVLCEMGAIAADDLSTHVKEQVTEIICSLFLWPRGEYAVRQADDGRDEKIILSIPIEDVILRGVRRVSDWPRIWRGLGESLERIFVTTSSGHSLGYHATLAADEAHLLSLVNGKLDVARLLELSYASEFDTCRALWALRLVGAIDPVEASHRPPSEDYALADTVEAYAALYTSIHRFVGEHLGDLVDHFMDRVAAAVGKRHPAVLADVHLRNQGRVEYEQLFANLRDLGEEERLATARRALDDLLAVLLEMTSRELGPDEELRLRTELEAQAELTPSLAQSLRERSLRE